MSGRSAESTTAAAYDRVAASYAAALPDDSYEAPADRGMIAEFAGRFDAGGRRVVDAGSGTGRMAPVLVRHGLDYIGVDVSPAMVRTAAGLHPDRNFIVGGLADLPLPNGSADGVLSWYSIIHTDPAGLPEVFAEFRRVLAPGGVLLLGFQAGSGQRVIRKAYGHDVDLPAHLHQPGHLQRHLESLGFLIEATLVRSPRDGERHDQAMVLARLPAHGSQL